MTKCLVGMSGGVDSSTSAVIACSQYDEVVGCTFKMFDSPTVEAAVEDAKKVADFLNIEHLVVDCREDFKKYVTNYFSDAYRAGVTPNPCVMCNKFVKFRQLNMVRREIGADVMMTGHYARIVKSKDTVELHQAKCLSKDQSYFLYKLSDDILRHTEFPLGNFTKSEVRTMAEKFGLHVAKKSESQDICFIPNGDYVAFINGTSGKSSESGDIVDENGKVLGSHCGIINYTIGQRKGLNLSGGPFFVKEICVQTNRIVVSGRNGVRQSRIDLDDVHFINSEYLGECEVKIRSANRKKRAKIVKILNKYIVESLEEEYGAAKGQHCVFYLDDLVLGGGIIC